MVIAIQALFFLYFLFVIILLIGWRRAASLAPSQVSVRERLPFITVIVPFRNESLHIQSLLNTLIRQTYPQDRMEVILADDHSEDQSGAIAKEWIRTHNAGQFKLIQLPEKLQGKKSAITEAIRLAKGEWVVTTDADCTVQPGWLVAMAKYIDGRNEMVCGPVRLEAGNTFFGSLQSLEFASLIGTGASTLALGMPTMCNGANLAFRKKAFEKVGGYEGNCDIASGDDEFLLRKIYARNPKGVKFSAFPESIVTAKALASVGDFFHQRVRWASKWKKHRLGVQTLVAPFIFLFHCAVVAVPVLGLTGRLTLAEIAILLGGKLIFEFMFLARVNKFLNTPFNAISLLALQIVYPLYVVLFGISANVSGTYWKGRKI